MKEGWDCPFAYILASLADKSSAVDVEQIVGRILRQPYVKKHTALMLNMSFVLTASARFLDTLDKIVKGLNKAGFSRKDYKIAGNEMQKEVIIERKSDSQILAALSGNEDNAIENIDVNKIKITPDAGNNPEANNILQELEKQAQLENEGLEKQIAAIENTGEPPIPDEIANKMISYKIKDVFREEAKKIILPQFFLKEKNLFAEMKDGDDHIFLAKENLLDEFRLSQEDTRFNFESMNAGLYKIELEKTAENESSVTFSEIQKKFQPVLLEYFSGEADDKVKSQLHGLLFRLLGNMLPITDNEIKKYLRKILDGLDAVELKEIASFPYNFITKIKEKIAQLADIVAEKRFIEWLDTDKIILKEEFRLKPQLVHKELAPAIAKSLYEREEKMNNFETDMASRIGSLENILFWHKNPVYKGFLMNGFLNHYPDFIVVTKSGKKILIETKGDHLDGSQSQAKIRLGEAWVRKAGNDYRYYMVFERFQVPGAITIHEMVNRLGKL